MMNETEAINILIDMRQDIYNIYAQMYYLQERPITECEAYKKEIEALNMAIEVLKSKCESIK